MPHYKANNFGPYWLDSAADEHLLPAGFEEITAEQAEAMRLQRLGQVDRAGAIRGRLAAIDTESIRPARAVAMALASGQAAPTFDTNKLAALEAEAATLRAELASLGT